MTKEQILEVIERTAAANGGRPLGRHRLEKAGVAPADWQEYWIRLGDAHRELGLVPNELSRPYDEETLLTAYANLCRECGRLPVLGDLRRKARNDATFPSHSTFARFAGKLALVRRVEQFCRRGSDYPDVLQMCEAYLAKQQSLPDKRGPEIKTVGFVYLIKAGRHYKFGKTNCVARRAYELGALLPKGPKVVHYIETDDPFGIEAYWKRRFREKRITRELFELEPADVAAFTWRSRM